MNSPRLKVFNQETATLIPNSSLTSKQLQAQKLFNVSLLNLCSVEKTKESLTGRAGCETYCQKVNNTSAISDTIYRNTQDKSIFRFMSIIQYIAVFQYPVMNTHNRQAYLIFIELFIVCLLMILPIVQLYRSFYDCSNVYSY